METMKLVFDREKPTANKIRFKERVKPGGSEKIGPLYVKKPLAGTARVLEVTITEVASESSREEGK